MESVWPIILDAVKSEAGFNLSGSEPQKVRGGCINEAYLVGSSSGDTVFIKVNQAEKSPMFESEFLALEELAATKAIRVPRPYAIGRDDRFSFIAMEGVSISTCSSSRHQMEMGRQVAMLHQNISSDRKFGWHRENVIGETLQQNEWSDSWSEFFVNQRLKFQLDLAEAGRGLVFENRTEFLKEAFEILKSHQPVPGLLHGDLWGGNVGVDEAGAPLIYDPATYYGDPETDIAFTSMFGGFSPEFYAAYHSELPLKPGAVERKPLYNLYHVLNHFNLFGGGYGSQARQMIDQIMEQS